MNEEEGMGLIYEIFDPSMPRLGPGDSDSTKKALGAALAALPDGVHAASSTELRILDVGCGNGAQTLRLAGLTKASIVAVDNRQPYLDELQRRAEHEGVADRVRTRCVDMADMGLDEKSFEVVWSEGALYCMGFREGLEACHRLLVPRGVMAVTELTWLRSDVPAECRDFFASEYPVMTDTDTNVATIKGCKYEMLSVFTLPSDAWISDFYAPLERRLQAMREKYASDPERLALIDSCQTEIDIHGKYSDFYGYVFYVMRRRG